MKRNKTVLCVEADPISSMVRRLVLKSFGYDVVVAHDPRDGMALMRAREVDAVVLVCDDSEIPSAVRMFQDANPVPVVVIAETPFIDFQIRRVVAAVITRGDRPDGLRSALRRALQGSKVRKSASLIAFAAGYVSVAAGTLFQSVAKRVSKPKNEQHSQSSRRTHLHTRNLGAAAAAH